LHASAKKKALRFGGPYSDFFLGVSLTRKKKLLRLLPLTLWVIVALRFFCHPLGDKTSTSST